MSLAKCLNMYKSESLPYYTPAYTQLIAPLSIEGTCMCDPPAAQGMHNETPPELKSPALHGVGAKKIDPL